MRNVVLAASLCLVTIAAVLVVLIHPRRTPVTILMYHAVTKEDDRPEPSIGLGLFTRQMAFLSEHGYEPVFLKTMVDRHGSGRVPSNRVVLTFDSPDEEFYVDVYPLLKRHGFKATVFVVVSDVGSDGGLTWEQLRRMSDSGLIEIGSHSSDHVPDECLSPARAREDEAKAKAILEANLGILVVTYAYPYGAFSGRAKGMLREIGYRGAVGTVYRRDEFASDDVFNLRRVYVSRYASLPLMFRFMLSGYYVPTRALILRVLDIKTPRDVPCDGQAEASP